MPDRLDLRVTHSPGAPCSRNVRGDTVLGEGDDSEVTCMYCLRVPLARPGYGIGDQFLVMRGGHRILHTIYGLNRDGVHRYWANGGIHAETCPCREEVDHEADREAAAADGGG